MVIDKQIWVENGDSKSVDSADNKTIDLITIDGVDYHFAKENQVVDGVCDNAVNEPLIDMQIHGNSVQGRLPSEYQQVEYIQNDGTQGETQYIDTGVLASENNSFEVKAQLVNADTISQTVWGGRHTSTSHKQQSNQLSYIKSTGTYQFACGNDSNAEGLNWDTELHIFYANKNTLYIDGVLEKTVYASQITENNNVYLFATNTAGTAGFSGGSLKMYYCKIWIEDKLVRDYIPCYRIADNAVGFYDLVEQKFYTNMGTGNFTAGLSTPTPETPIEIQSVGERTKNLIDYKTFRPYRNGTITLLDNGLEYTGSYYIVTDGSYLMSGKEYFMSFDYESVDGIRPIWRFGYTDGTYSGQTQNKQSITVPSDKIVKSVLIYGEVNDNIHTTRYYNIILSEGTLSEYEPYGYKVPVKVSGENLFDKTKTLKGFLPITGVYPTTNSTYPNACYQIIDIKAGQTVNIDFYNKKDINGRIRYIDNDTNQVVGTITSPPTDYYISTIYQNSGFRDGEITALKDFKLGVMYLENFESDFNLQINQVSTTTIYLKEPLRKIGDYADYIDYKNKKVVRKIATKVFDGTEQINVLLNGIKYNYIVLGSSGLVVNDICLCTHLQHQPNFSYQVEGNNKFRVLNSSPNNQSRIVFRFYLNGEIVSDVDQVKALLTEYYNAGTPMIVYYAHADELKTEEPIEIPEISTFDGTSIFDTGTEIKPSQITVDYWKQI